MRVFAFSRAVYAKLGDEVTNELVDLMNDVLESASTES